MFARPADRIHVAALTRIQRGALQQLAHAEHPGHRRADLVAQRRQETRLRLRRLLGQRLSLRRELPGVPAAQALPVRPCQRDHGQQQHGGEPGLRPNGAPPWRRHEEHQVLLQGGVAGGILRAHPQRVAPRRKAGEHALAARTQRDPVVLEPVQPRPVAVRRRIIEDQQARADPQLAIGAIQADRVLQRQLAPFALAAHRDAVEAQRRTRRRGIGRGRVHQDQAAIRSRGDQHAIAAQQGRAIQILLVAETVLHADVAQVSPRGFPAVQAAAGGEPDPVPRVHEQPCGRDRRHAMARFDAVDACPAIRLTPVLLKPGKTLQPQDVGAVERQRMDAFTPQRLHRLEAALGDVVARDAVQPGDPWLA